MGQTPEEIRSDIDATRKHMSQSVNEIEARIRQSVEPVRRAVDVKSKVARHPWAAIAASMAAGAAVGLLWPDRSPRQGRLRSLYQAADPRRLASSLAPQQPGVTDKIADAFGDELKWLKTAAVSAAIGMGRSWIKGKFHDEVAPQLAPERVAPERGHSARSSISQA